MPLKLVLTQSNKDILDRLSSPAMYTEMVKCADQNAFNEDDYPNAWDACSSRPEFKSVDAVIHGENPNLGRTHRKTALEFTEATLSKVEKLTNDVLDVPLSPINKVLDSIEKPAKDTKLGGYVHKRMYTDPSVQSKKLNSKEWAGLMAGSTIASHLITGDVSAPILAGLTVANAAKGAVIGPLFTGGKDTLLKNVVIPAGVVAAGTHVVNTLGEELGAPEYADFLPEARAGAAATFGGSLWALRNRKNSNRKYY